jgi:orotate phosphoribosyltransferase
MFDKPTLVALIRDKALRFGDFTLASGQKSSYYLDGKQVTLDSHGAALAAQGILEALGQPLPAAVGGMSIGADPIVGALITLAGLRGLPLKGFLVRKEAKGHGTQKYIEGPVQPGDTAVIVEDVVTTGGSSLAAIERAEAVGLRVVGVVAIVDRLQGGAAEFEQRGYPFRSLLTIRDLGIVS